MMDITTVPCSPQSIKGLINLRGSIITVVDPYVILNINDSDKKSENIIIIETENEVLGIIVDRVEEVADIDNNLVKNISVSKEDDRDYLRGTINMGDYIVTLINVDALLNIENV
jgi:purine-binding chemotaxis protein CheW